MDVVLQLIKFVENKISDLDRNINKTISKDKDAYRNMLSNQLLLLKDAKVKGNSKKYGFLGLFGETNNHIIHQASELRREIEVRKKSKRFDTVYEELVIELEKLENKQDHFNKTKTVTVKLYEDLNLIKGN